MTSKLNPIVLTSEQKQLLDNLLRPLHTLTCFNQLRDVGGRRIKILPENLVAIRDQMKEFLCRRPEFLVKDALHQSAYDLEELYGLSPGYVRTENGSTFRLNDEWQKSYYPLFVTWVESVGLKKELNFWEDLPLNMRSYHAFEVYGGTYINDIAQVWSGSLPTALLMETLVGWGVETLADLVLLPVSKVYEAIQESKFSDEERSYRVLCEILAQYHLSLGMSLIKKKDT